MTNHENNFAYIDGANLHKGIQELGWSMDYARFRRWLEEKYGIKEAYLFIGLIPKHNKLYIHLRKAGFILIFKQTHVADGKTKGNCDAELVLKAVSDYYEKKFKKAVIITGDGDFACLVDFLLMKGSLRSVIAPNSQKISYLLRKIQAPLVFLDFLRGKLVFKEKAPTADETGAGSFTS